MTNDDKALVERLRHFDYNVDIATFYDEDPECVSEAADHIEALTAENERLRAECDTYKVALAAIIEPRIGGGEWAASVARKALTQHLANNATIGDLELPRRLVKHLGAEEPATLIFDILEDKKHRLWSNIGYRDERIMREVATFLDPARAALGEKQ